jgi:hypothetical protein
LVSKEKNDVWGIFESAKLEIGLPRNPRHGEQCTPRLVYHRPERRSFGRDWRVSSISIECGYFDWSLPCCTVCGVQVRELLESNVQTRMLSLLNWHPFNAHGREFSADPANRPVDAREILAKSRRKPSWAPRPSEPKGTWASDISGSPGNGAKAPSMPALGYPGSFVLKSTAP